MVQSTRTASSNPSYVTLFGHKIHRAWIMLFGCSVLTAGTLGAIFGACGVFYVPICDDLGFKRNEIASWQQAHFLSMTFAMPLAGYIIERFDIRKVMTICAIACAASAALMGTYTEIWQWVCSGIVYGTLGTCLMQLPQATILGNWFQKRMGLAMGISTAVGSIGTAACALIFAQIIASTGWRTAYFIQGIVVACASLPFTIFVFRLRPSDIGALPYGYDSEETKIAENKQRIGREHECGVSPKKGLPSLTFIMIFMFAGISALVGSGFDAHLPGYAQSIGYSALFGASLVSALQLGSFCEKLAMGWANDRFGVENTAYIEFTCVVLGMLGLVFFKNEVGLLIAAFLFGVQDSFTSVTLPLLLRKFFGEKYFARYYSIARMGSGIFGSFGSRLVGLSYDITTSFAPAFLIAAVVCCVGALCITVARSAAKRLVWDSGDSAQ